MALIYVFIFGSVLVFGLTAVAGLVWAVRTGQMRNFSVGATSIFDDDEPVGVMTDTFPDAERQTTTNAIQEGRDGEQRD
jgi:nitrogen fixation-related uncharacterized protein